MVFPKKIKIGGLTYKIVFCEIDDAFGDTDFTKGVIRIDKNQKEEQKIATLLHEILHCLNSQLSEETTEFLAQGIYQVLIHNKFIKLPKNKEVTNKRIRNKKVDIPTAHEPAPASE